ncbi:MAG: DUF434 domain-containing protein [Lachnospiraceae bacterium]|nr:DUF434 domain-containing protein [Lachnospiraceae bacterium]
MSKIVQRGYAPSDEKEFKKEGLNKLYEAGRDLYYLLNRGYYMKGASVFVGNHYMLSERQRLALVRGISTKEHILLRKEKEIKASTRNSLEKDCGQEKILQTGLKGKTVHIDGFNTIITLEVAFSGSTLLKCKDGTIRDLAGLRGTYRLIDKTDMAISSIGEILEEEQVKKAIFYLDAPVSNSGRLKERVRELLEPFAFEVEFEVINDVDRILHTKECVISGDAIILDHCESWFNLVRTVMENKMPEYEFVDFE